MLLLYSMVPLRRSPLLGMLGFVLLVRPAAADIVIFRGKVVMEDGSPPGLPVTIQRTCEGMDRVIVEATVSPKTGDYFVRLDINDFGFLFSGANRSEERRVGHEGRSRWSP